MAVLAAVLLCLPLLASAADVTLEWNPVDDPYLAGYKVHYGLASRTYTGHLDVGNVVRHTVAALEECKSYYLSVTSYNSFGDESAPSNEVPLATPCPVQETVTTPSAPAGPTQGLVGEAYTYSAAGAVSNLGDSVQYRFSWSDGSVSGWLPAGTTSATKTWVDPGAYTAVLVEARCSLHPSVVSAASAPIAVTIAGSLVETISTPPPPSGPTSGFVGVVYAYTAGGAASSAGDPVQYRFSWADGTVSEWLPAASAAASKSWSVSGTYTQVRVEARCALHPEVASAPSAAITVVIGAATAETLSPPAVLSGPTAAQTGTSHPFTAGGAASDLGDPVRYRFEWGDGTVSAWAPDVPALAWKNWLVPGDYLVTAEAGCVLHPPVTALSAGFNVAVTENPALLFRDDFDNATERGDPEWRALSGRWAGQSGALVAAATGADNLILVRLPGTFPGGRIDSRLRLLPREDTTPNAGIVFSYLDGAHYRYLLAYENRLVLGQVGETPGAPAGPVQTVRIKLPPRTWHTLSTQVYPDGTVRAYLDDAEKPILRYRFNDYVPGKVGYLARRSRAAFDEMRVFHESVLPERN